jgi:hypothetical protein
MPWGEARASGFDEAHMPTDYIFTGQGGMTMDNPKKTLLQPVVCGRAGGKQQILRNLPGCIYYSRLFGDVELQIR